MLLPRPEATVFDIQAFDRQLRSHYPEIATYDLTLPRPGQNVTIHATLTDGTRRAVRFTGLQLVGWGAYR
jgi:hypothetical protein